MATVDRPRSFDRSETQRRIRHPLQALTGYIRRYVMLEGAAVALIYLAVCFWVWLLLDFGTFWLFSTDAVKWLDRTYPSGTAFFVRAFVLGMAVAGLLAVVALKVLRRLFTEFSDGALALVLERRYPQQLGDRLITAVELADPRLAEKYGFSQEMIDFTIRNAAERVDQVPVAEVFNWRRLRRQWLLVAACTVGVYVLLFVACAAYLALAGNSPTDYFAGFNRTASVWGKRNGLLMHHVYWPTNAYVEFVRPQLAQTRPDGIDTIKIARDEQRPELPVRAFKWVVYDPSTPESVRPLRLADLKGWVDSSLLDIPLDENWPHWIMDLADLDPSVPNTLVSESWTGKSREYVKAQVDALRQTPREGDTAASDANLAKLNEWLNWKTWTVDQLEAQLEKDNKKVRQLLRSENGAAYAKIEKLLETLDDLSQSSSANWNIRQLAIPEGVQTTFIGKQTRSSKWVKHAEDDNRYGVSLGDLKESSMLYVQAGNFYPLPKDIVLVPPPQLDRLDIELDEPAYKYYRIQGDQSLLKGARHRSVKQLSLTGANSQYDVLAGSRVHLVARAERDLKPEIKITRPTQPLLKTSKMPRFKNVAGNAGAGGFFTISPEDDNRTFAVDIDDVQEDYEFEFQFIDQDKVRGSRHVVIRVTHDRAPKEVAKLSLAVNFRMPTVSATDGEDSPGAAPANAPKGYLITPKALLPFRGIMDDDIGLTRMDWVYDYEEVYFSLFPGAGTTDPKLLLRQKLEAGFRAQIAAARVLQQLPALTPGGVAAALAWQREIDTLEKQIALLRKDSAPEIVKGPPVAMENFMAMLEASDANHAISPAVFRKLLNDHELTGRTAANLSLPKEYSVELESGFDVNKILYDTLRPKGNDVQKHFRLRVWMSATDNNVETGPHTKMSKEPVIFLVVSEAELRALILQQEDKLRSDLENIRDTLDKDVKVLIADQIEKLKLNKDQDLTTIRLRVDNGISKNLEKANKIVNTTLTEYQKIRNELFYNRMDPLERLRIDRKVIDPLESITHLKQGELVLTQGAVNKTHSELEADESKYNSEQGKPLPLLDLDRHRHINNLMKTQAQLDGLVKKLSEIIQNIGAEFDRKKAEADLVAIIEQQQRQVYALRDEKKRIEEEILKLLQGDGTP